MAVSQEHPDIPQEWLTEFEAAARRPLPQRMKYAFIRTYKPVMDDAKHRSFDTTADYRKWCEENLPDWLGCGCIRISPGAGKARFLIGLGYGTRRKPIPAP